MPTRQAGGRSLPEKRRGARIKSWAKTLHVWRPVQTGLVSDRHKRLSIVFVCTGNICRSPMAAIIFADAVRRAGLAHQVQVSSAGTGSWHVGEPADPRAVKTLRRAGYACEHVAAQVGSRHLSADLLVALDHGHLAALRRIVAEPGRVVLLRSFDPAAGRNLDVPDPYYGGKHGFDQVLTMIRAAVPSLVTWVRDRL
jgi:protein-tyrosine phosphatase